MKQVRQARRQTARFLPTDKRAIQMFGRQEFRPVIDGITIGLKVLSAVHRNPHPGYRRRRRHEHHAGLRKRACT